MDENVQFTVFRPTSLVPATWHTLLVFAHLSEKRSSASEEPDPIEEVRRQAQAILGDSAAHSQQTVDSGEPIPRDGELTIVPRAEDIEFNPPRRSFLWTDENVHREEFRLRAAATLPDGMVRGRVSVFLGSLIIAEIALTLKVNRAAATTQVDIEHEAARPYRKIFASYSRHDAAIVAEYSDYARAMGDRYLQDVVELRSGERWEPRLEEFIRQADVFQLFWSWNAMASTNVSKEWQYALAINRRAFVRPVYWDDPFPKRADLPPPELLALNFERIRPRRQPPRAVSPATSPEASAAAPKPDRAMLSTPAPRRPSASAMPPPVIRESTRYPHSFEPTASAPAPAKRSSRWLAVVGFIAAAIVLLAVLVFFFR